MRGLPGKHYARQRRIARRRGPTLTTLFRVLLRYHRRCERIHVGGAPVRGAVGVGAAEERVGAPACPAHAEAPARQANRRERIQHALHAAVDLVANFTMLAAARPRTMLLQSQPPAMKFEPSCPALWGLEMYMGIKDYNT